MKSFIPLSVAELENNLYRKAFNPDGKFDSEKAVQKLIQLLQSTWKNNQLTVLFFGYGWGLTEHSILKAIDVFSQTNSSNSDRKATIYLVDTKESESDYGPLNQRPRIKSPYIDYVEYNSLDEVELDEFDLVTAYFSLHLIPRWPRFLLALSKKVKFEGLFSFSVERGYRAWIDGATNIGLETNCSCRSSWRNYHDTRIHSGNGWLPEISASNLSVIGDILNDNFGLVKVDKCEFIEINYPDNDLNYNDIIDIVDNSVVFYPLKTSIPKLQDKSLDFIKNCNCSPRKHSEKADLFFLKKRTKYQPNNDEVFFEKTINALACSAVSLQGKLALPVMMPGFSEDDNRGHMQRVLYNMLHILYSHFVRNCARAACEFVFVKYKSMSEFYSMSDSDRSYIEKLPMVVQGDKEWGNAHKKAYSQWRQILLSKNETESSPPWIGLFVMELFPWVGNWKINFNCKNTSINVKKNRFSPHMEDGKAKWRSNQTNDILEINIKGVKSDNIPPQGSSQRSWIEHSETLIDTFKSGNCNHDINLLNNELKEELLGLFIEQLRKYGYPYESVKLKSLCTLLTQITEVNKDNKSPWKSIDYVALPQTVFKRTPQLDSLNDCNEHAGIGIVFYTYDDDTFSSNVSSGISQFLSAILRMTQLQFQYLYLNEKQAVLTPDEVEQYRVNLGNSVDVKYRQLSDKFIDEFYSAVYPLEDLSSFNGHISKTIDGMKIDGLSPTHSANNDKSLANMEVIRKSTSDHSYIRGYFKNIDIELGEECSFYKHKLKACLSRHKGSFVPIDLFYKIECNEKNVSESTSSENPWEIRAKSSIKYIFWDIQKCLKSYIQWLEDSGWIVELDFDTKKTSSTIMIRHQSKGGEESIQNFWTIVCAIIRGDLGYGDWQGHIKEILSLRERLGCYRENGINYNDCTNEKLIEYGEIAKSEQGISIWWNVRKDLVDLVVWIEHRS
ncbi:MAG: hypothetical protein HRT51_09360 [Colwellia sp.]|nr:hypothetical protein [Colwellia sp.]